MDLDMAKSGLDGRAEDDMIDFDTDMADSSQDLQEHDDNLKTVGREMQEDGDDLNHHAYEMNGMMGENVEINLDDVEDIVHSRTDVDYKVSEAPEYPAQEPAAKAQFSDDGNQEKEGNAKDVNETAIQGDDVSEDYASAHEIDYEYEDETEHTRSRQDATADPTSQPTESGEEHAPEPATDHGSHHAGNSTPVIERDDIEHAQEERYTSSSHGDHYGPQSPPEAIIEHEVVAFDGIEVEDLVTDEDAQANAIEGNEEFREEDYITSHEKTADLGMGQDHGTLDYDETAEVHTYHAGESGSDAHNEDEMLEPEYANNPASDEDLNGKSNDDFPAITVQYKGDEFPMFSTTTNSFFADTSVLDRPLEELLAGLRKELENEVAMDDDLVLQVDELGLEISEATRGGLMSNVTFRQILEIFDLLIKNQDPDSSRTLYTYLFTKPNTEKRLESLIESAAAGKGLDEVIHLFETPATVDASILETAATIDGVHEELDEFDSPVDDYPDEEQSRDGEYNEAGEAEVDDEYSTAEPTSLNTSIPGAQEAASHEGDAQDDHEVNIETRVESPTEASAVEEADAATENEHYEQNGKATSHSTDSLCCYSPCFCLCRACVSEYAEEHNQEETVYRRSLKGNERHIFGPQLRKPISKSSPYKHAHSASDFSTVFSFNETDEFRPARTASDVDPFANLELDDDAEVNGNVILEVAEQTEQDYLVETEAISAQTDGTCTTTTLQEEEEAAAFNIDLGQVSTEVEVTGNVDVEGDDLNEIDWRDEPEADDQEPTTPSAAGKRSRDDDDVHEVEIEQDAKRRRP
ncbi:hypothetical protein NW768_011048 [Fusarium equiseti]|uniref:Uncharacterized protein n=1 Tax=Fusarium equiseti TaxID=61235 RepID=A0ABQ8QYR5_FUSEQ|nr:hypothetical protein NW768_011048 [Fusarium equiseti]